jgi:hypothetical protein
MSTEKDDITYSEKFPSLIVDFTSALSTTFPEFASLWSKYNQDTTELEWLELYQYCLDVYPERFFDILYQNEDMFDATHNHNLKFLPDVDFYRLYHCPGVTTQTRESIWKYIQLILFTVIGSVKDKNDFGETMNLFEGIDETELQSQLSSAMGNIGDFFKNTENDIDETEKDIDETEKDVNENLDGVQKEFQDTLNSFAETFTNSKEGVDEEAAEEAMNNMEKNMSHVFEKMESMFDNVQEEQTQVPPPTRENMGFNPNDMPDAENIHEHLKGLFGGKLGALASELMEELTDDLQDTLGIDPNSTDENANPKDVFKTLLRHPDKFMKIVQKIHSKFQDRMKSGDLSQEDIMREAGDMLKKMKDMGGNSKEMKEMFQNMAKSMGGMGGMNTKNMRVDTNAIDRMMKMQSTKERLRAKVEKRKQENYILKQTQDPNHFVYTPINAELQERSGIKPITQDMTQSELDDLVSKIEGNLSAPQNTAKSTSNKKKKNKKKK